MLGGGSGTKPDLKVRRAHTLTVVAAFGVWAYLDRHLWFYGDEWDFLTRRGLHGAYFSLWAPHNEHWSVLPILLWRSLYSIFHLTTYWPYLVPVLLANAAIVHLVWRRCLKEGADPWVATVLGGLLALFGPGAEDLTWAFQIGFLGSLVLGFGAWEVADRVPVAKRVWAVGAGASALALAAMMCSTVGLAASAGLAVLLVGLCGWRRAAAVMALPFAAYAVWFVLEGRQGVQATGDTLNAGVLLRAPVFIAWNLSNVIGSATSLVVLGPVFALGIAAWALRSSARLYRCHLGALAGLCAAAVFFLLAALARDRISWTLSPSRYLYIGLAFLVPLLAVMATSYLEYLHTRVGRGRPWARWAMVAAVLVATGANTEGAVNFAASRTSYVNSLKHQIVSSGALLQSGRQEELAVNPWPIRGSGLRAGYLSTALIAQLYRQGLLGKVNPRSLGALQLLVDESWLDITRSAAPKEEGRFRLLAVARFEATQVRQGAKDVLSGQRWPAGPGDCSAFVPRRVIGPDGRLEPAWLELGGLHEDQSGSAWVSLGSKGGTVYVALAQTWGGQRGSDPRLGAKGEQVRPGSGSSVWVNEDVPGDGLVLRTNDWATIEVCGLARPRAQ